MHLDYFNRVYIVKIVLIFTSNSNIKFKRWLSGMLWWFVLQIDREGPNLVHILIWIRPTLLLDTPPKDMWRKKAKVILYWKRDNSMYFSVNTLVNTLKMFSCHSPPSLIFVSGAWFYSERTQRSEAPLA